LSFGPRDFGADDAFEADLAALEAAWVMVSGGIVLERF
jgi:hypothetical protein